MITKIELDGFKTFQDFELELGPFQVIVGPNGAGKSNLFDALRLMVRLVNQNETRNFLNKNLSGLRHETDKVFTILPNNKEVDRLRLAVEMFVDAFVEDTLGQKVDIKFRRLRYELEFTRFRDDSNETNVRLTHEELSSIPKYSDTWAIKYNLYEKWLKNPEDPLENPTYIYTENKGDFGEVFILADNIGTDRNYGIVERIQPIILANITNTDYAHAFAAKKEIQKWNFLELHPFYGRRNVTASAIAPSMYIPRFDSELSLNLNLAETLTRLKTKNPFLFSDVTRDLSNLVPEIVKLEVEKDHLRNENIIFATTRDGRRFPWQSLSDGTLRLLALATLNNDPEFEGVLCIEEPENGVHPFRLKQMATLLNGMATDFSDIEQANLPLRQVLITTHSPVLISQKEVIGNVLFAYLVTRVGDSDNPPLRVTHIEPVQSNRSGKNSQNKYTIEQVKKYLESAESSEAIDILEGMA
jgi:predicted ATPase